MGDSNGFSPELNRLKGHTESVRNIKGLTNNADISSTWNDSHKNDLTFLSSFVTSALLVNSRTINLMITNNELNEIK